jgi:hypothetical protein
MCPVRYSTMIRSHDHKYQCRLELVLHAHRQGIHTSPGQVAAVRQAHGPEHRRGV